MNGMATIPKTQSRLVSAVLPDLVNCSYLGYFLSSCQPNFKVWRLGILATFLMSQKTGYFTGF